MAKAKSDTNTYRSRMKKTDLYLDEELDTFCVSVVEAAGKARRQPTNKNGIAREILIPGLIKLAKAHGVKVPESLKDFGE